MTSGLNSIGLDINQFDGNSNELSLMKFLVNQIPYPWILFTFIIIVLGIMGAILCINLKSSIPKHSKDEETDEESNEESSFEARLPNTNVSMDIRD